MSCPTSPRDTTDRNRTSPFAFTGNKFEFRMLGSSNSIACANIMLNAAVAEIPAEFMPTVWRAPTDFETALHDLIQETIKDHKRIIFNGNGYDDAWIKEATEERGLLNLPHHPGLRCRHLLDKKNVDMLTAHKVFSEAEIAVPVRDHAGELLQDRHHRGAAPWWIWPRKQILPAVEGYAAELAASVAAKKAVAPRSGLCL